MQLDFEGLWDECPDALIAHSMDGKVLRWNSAAEAIFGYTASEAIGQSLFALIVLPDQLDQERRSRDEAMKSPLTVREAVRRRKDGTLVYVNVSARAVLDADGTFRYFLSSKQDVTDLKALRDARSVDARFGALLESTPDAIVMVNVTGRMVLVNRQAEAMFGRPRAELLGAPLEILLPARLRDAHHAHRGAFFGNPRARAMGAGLNLHGLRANGDEFPVEISLSPLETEAGTMAMSAIRDVTERRYLEQVLRDKNLELQEAASTKGRFFASVSHELRTPLNAVLGFTGTLLMKLPGPLNAEQEKQLGYVQKGARQLLSLINDLLDLSRLGSSPPDLKIDTVDCNRLVEEVVASARSSAEEKGLTLEVILPGSPLSIRTDHEALRRIVTGLVENAIRATPRGSVGVRLDRVLGEGATIISIRVEDQGLAIPESERQGLFEAFSKARDAEGRDVDGTGLELHLSRRRAQALGGEIRTEGRAGSGSALTLTLRGR